MRNANVILLAFCVHLVAVSVDAANTPSKFSREHLAAAKLLDAKQWDRAAETYRRIVEQGPRDSLAPNAQYGLFLAVAGSGDQKKARKELQALEQLVKEMKRENRLSGQHPIEAWLFRIRSESGRLYEESGEFAEAAREYEQAASEMGTRPQMADWRARASIATAKCLHDNRQTAKAIEILHRTLAELNRPEFAGMRALQTATIAKLYSDQGHSRKAEKLLGELKADPQIDDSQLAAARVLVTGEAPPSEVSDLGQHMRTRRGPDYLAIESAGRYEIRIALQDVGRNLFGENRYGWITGWYNLEADPFKTRNLVSLSYFPLLKPHHLTWLEKRDGEWKRIDSRKHKAYSQTVDIAFGMQKGPSPRQQGNVKFEVLEDTPTRVRTRTSHDRWPFESMEYTFYPTGQIFVAAHFDLENEDPRLRIGSVSFYTVKNAQINWRDSTDETSRMPGEGGQQFNTTYVLSHNNRVPSFHLSMPDDILTCAPAPHDRRTFINNEIPLMWRRTPLRFDVDRSLEEKSFALQLRVFPRNIDSFAAGLPYVEDYRNPTKLTVSGGELVRNSIGDLNGDGYNESQGCFVVRADGKQLDLTMDATDRPCFQPAFCVENWSGSKTPQVTIDGKPAELGSSANISIVGTTALIQLLNKIDGGTVSLTVK